MITTFEMYQVSQKNVPLAEVLPSSKGTFFLGHPVKEGSCFTFCLFLFVLLEMCFRLRKRIPLRLVRIFSDKEKFKKVKYLSKSTIHTHVITNNDV